MHKMNARSWTYDFPQSSFDLNDQEDGVWTEYAARQQRPPAAWVARLCLVGLNEDGNRVAGGRHQQTLTFGFQGAEGDNWASEEQDGIAANRTMRSFICTPQHILFERSNQGDGDGWGM
jgi:hypothetical protein